MKDKNLLKELIELAEDGYKWHCNNGCHQEFLNEDKDVLRKAKNVLKAGYIEHKDNRQELIDKDKIYKLIEESLLSAKLKHIGIDEANGDRLPLVDFLSVGSKDISDGKEEITNLVEQIYFDIDKHLSAKPYEGKKSCTSCKWNGAKHEYRCGNCIKFSNYEYDDE